MIPESTQDTSDPEREGVAEEEDTEDGGQEMKDEREARS